MSLYEAVIVFDLDDTLISELEYLRSGISAVEKHISEIFQIPFSGNIHQAYDSGISDIWEWTAGVLNLPPVSKLALINAYRFHMPTIKLFPGIQECLEILKSRQYKICILTDGRSSTQRLKMFSTGLLGYPVYISEEYSSEKPSTVRFRAIEDHWPSSSYFYIADNPLKDFQAPQTLNWYTIGANWVLPRVHLRHIRETPQPHIWLDDPSLLPATIERRVSIHKT